MLDDEILAYIDRSLQSYKEANTYKQPSERYNSYNDLNQNDLYHDRRSSNVDDFDRVFTILSSCLCCLTNYLSFVQLILNSLNITMTNQCKHDIIKK